MKKKDYFLISLLTLAALVISYFATYSSYCGWEGCTAWSGFPLPLLLPGGAGYGTYPYIPGIIGNSVLYFGIFWLIFKVWKKKKPSQE